MIWSNAVAVRWTFQPGELSGVEKPNPGGDGMTTWKASSARPPCAAGSTSGPIIRVNSTNELGQPWSRRRGVASCTDERTWTKWIVWRSIDVVNWGNVFRKASWAGQSNSLAQRSASVRAYEVGTPRLQSATTSDGQRVLTIRARRSST